MKVLTSNRKARFNYDIIETMEAGLVLSGAEVKSVRLGRASLSGSHLSIKEGEVWLTNTSIPPYQVNNTPASYKIDQDRKILLNKNEIRSLIGQTKEKGATLIPLRIYTKKNKIKLEIALARGRSKKGKRDVLKKRDLEREMRLTF